MLASKRVLLYFICISVKWISATQSNNFSFKKTFKTPRETYEDNVAKLDKLEILERSGFASDESRDKTHTLPNPPQECPRAVANALVNFRLPEMGSRHQDFEHHGHHPLSDVYHNSFPVPYYPPYFAHPHNIHKKSVDHTKPCTINIFNVFSTPRTGCQTEGNVPHVYLFPQNKDGTTSAVNDVWNQNVSKLSEDDFAALDNIINSGILETPQCQTKTTPCSNKLNSSPGKQYCSPDLTNQSPDGERQKLDGSDDVSSHAKNRHHGKCAGNSNSAQGQVGLPNTQGNADVQRFTSPKSASATTCPFCQSNFIRYDDCAILPNGQRNVYPQAYPTRGQSVLVPWYSWRSAKPEQHFAYPQAGDERCNYAPPAVVYQAPPRGGNY